MYYQIDLIKKETSMKFLREINEIPERKGEEVDQKEN